MANLSSLTKTTHAKTHASASPEAEALTTLSKTLANEYFLMLKTQNFHWNVEGPMFFSLHKLFEEQYGQLGEFVDRTAEVIRAHDKKAPGTFREFSKLASMQEAASDQVSASQMIDVLSKDHSLMAMTLKEALIVAEEANDTNTVTLYEDLITFHEKAAWMIRSHK